MAFRSNSVGGPAEPQSEDLSPTSGPSSTVNVVLSVFGKDGEDYVVELKDVPYPLKLEDIIERASLLGNYRSLLVRDEDQPCLYRVLPLNGSLGYAARNPSPSRGYPLLIHTTARQCPG